MRKIINIILVIFIYAMGFLGILKFKEEGSITYITLIVALLGQIVSILNQKDDGTNFSNKILKIKIKNFIKNTEKYKESLKRYLKPINENKMDIEKTKYDEYIGNIRKSIYLRIYDLFDKNFKSYYTINNPAKNYEDKIKILLEIQDIFIEYEHVANNVPYSNINCENVINKYGEKQNNMIKDDIFYINQIIEKAQLLK